MNSELSFDLAKDGLTVVWSVNGEPRGTIILQTTYMDEVIVYEDDNFYGMNERVFPDESSARRQIQAIVEKAEDELIDFLTR